MADLYWMFITGQVGVVMGGWAQGLIGQVVVFNLHNQSTLVQMQLSGEGTGAPGTVAKKGIFSFEYRARGPAPYPPYAPYSSGVELRVGTPTALGYNILNYEYRIAATKLFAELFQYNVTLEEGVASCSPAGGDNVLPGVSVTITAVPETDYVISSVLLNGVEVGNDYTFTPLEQAYTIKVVAVPATTSVNVDISYLKTDCLPRTSIEYRGLDANGQPQSDGTAVTMGGTVYATGLTPTVCDSETPVTSNVVNVDVGSPFGVWAVGHDVRTRLVSLTVNGNDYVSNLSGGALPNQFVYCGSGVAGRPLNSGGLFFDVPTEAVSISAVFASDYVCVNRLPQLPKSGPVPPAPPAPGQPYPNPFPDPTAPNPFPIPVPGDTYPIPGFIPDGPEEGNPGDIPGGPGDDGGGGGGSTGGGGPDGIGSPFGTPESVRKVDQLGETSPRGLIIRWRNDAGKWSKEHVIDLGTIGQTNLFKQICPMGDYVTRQWEIIHIDAIPFAVVYLEEEVEKRNE